MAVTFPIPWSSREHWQSELELDPVEPRQIGEVRLWIDMAPGASATVADPKRQFDAAGMVDWISSNRELAVSSKQSVAVAGLPAVVLDWTVSPTATSGIDAFLHRRLLRSRSAGHTSIAVSATGAGRARP